MAHGVTITVEGIPANRLTADEIVAIYQRTHGWLHEQNPFVKSSDELLREQEGNLWRDVDRMWSFLERHFISIQDEGFYCTLKDKVDAGTKVLPLSKVAA